MSKRQVNAVKRILRHLTTAAAASIASLHASGISVSPYVDAALVGLVVLTGAAHKSIGVGDGS